MFFTSFQKQSLIPITRQCKGQYFFVVAVYHLKRGPGPISLMCMKFVPQDFIFQELSLWRHAYQLLPPEEIARWWVDAAAVFFTRCMNPMKGHKISDSDCQMTPKKMRVPQFATNHNRLYNSTSPKSIQYMTLGPQRFREETKASYFIKEEPNINPPFIPKATLSPKWSNYQLSFSAWKQTKTTTQHSLSFFKSVWFCVVLWVPCFLFFFFYSSSSSSSIFLFSSFPPFFLFPFFFFSPASYFSIPSPPSFLLLLLPPTFLLLPFVLFFCFFLSFLFVFCCART